MLLGPPEDVAHARHQFTAIEGLDDVIIRAGLQPLDALPDLGARGDHDHRQIGTGADRAQELEATRNAPSSASSRERSARETSGGGRRERLPVRITG